MRRTRSSWWGKGEWDGCGGVGELFFFSDCATLCVLTRPEVPNTAISLRRAPNLISQLTSFLLSNSFKRLWLSDIIPLPSYFLSNPPTPPSMSTVPASYLLLRPRLCESTHHRHSCRRPRDSVIITQRRPSTLAVLNSEEIDYRGNLKIGRRMSSYTFKSAV